jgi:hypothetical protein
MLIKSKNGLTSSNSAMPASAVKVFLYPQV